MLKYVAFLRGINLGKRRLPMSQLKGLFEELAFDEVETFIASGNVLFSSRVKQTSQLESQIARQLEASLGYRVDTFVRTAEEVTAIGRTKVFPEDGQAGITIHVGFLQKELAPEVARKLGTVRTEEDELRVRGREYYWLCRVRTSDSKVWTLPAVKALRLPTSSMRNMTSIRKLIAKHLV
jgi:uncharacterized protein (DUF1697 family)